MRLPDGFTCGHFTDPVGMTGCTVLLAGDGAVAAGEVRGGGPGTRESDLLQPSANAQSVHALLFTGGSAFGLAAADGVVRWLEERKIGYATRAGIVPLVPAAVVYDLPLGSASARPDAASGATACDAALPDVVRGNVGAGTGCTVGKLLGSSGATKGGVGYASETIGGATVAALAVVNAFGEVLAEDGSILAGVWRDGAYASTVDLLQEGVLPRPLSSREATTLVAVVTDAKLDKLACWLVARAGSGGVAQAVQPSATAVDGDTVVCLAGGQVDVEPFLIAALAGRVVAAAIRDGVRSAAGVAGCPSAAARAAR